MDSSARQSLKRKLAEEVKDSLCKRVPPTFTSIILKTLFLLNSFDHVLLNKLITILVKLCKTTKHEIHDDFIDILVNNGAVQALVRILHLPEKVVEDYSDRLIQARLLQLKKGCAFILGTLAKKSVYQQLIIDAGAFLYLLRLLKSHKTIPKSPSVPGFLRRVVDAISKLAYKNNKVKMLIRKEDGIAPLIELLEFKVKKVQVAVTNALGTLAFDNAHTVTKMVECNALPSLVLMLQSEDSVTQFTTVQLIKIMVDTSPHIGREVLKAGALTPVICLLSSSFSESQALAALLLGHFLGTDSDLKVHISQRGAIPPLVHMLQSQNTNLRKASAFVLVILAQDSHNQVSIAHSGGIEPMLNLFQSDNPTVQQYAARVLYSLADNEDIVANIIKVGGFEKLKDLHFTEEPISEFVAITLLRLERHMQGRTLKYLIHLMCSAEERVRNHVVIALAHLCSPPDHETVFIHNEGLELLLNILQSQCTIQKRKASMALSMLASRANFISSLIQTISPSPTSQMDLGEESINNPKLSDITFLVEGKIFYANKDRLVSSSVFQTMFEAEYFEKETKQAVIPNIKWDVFKLMMRFIYTGTVDVKLDDAKDLLRAADQYLLQDLKLICERVIAKSISPENVSLLLDLSEDFSANTLKNACILYMLEKFDRLHSKRWYYTMLHRIVPDIDTLFSTLLIMDQSNEDASVAYLY
ncbi:hypothetical protein PHAVU_006G001300 [Phaseolus vulgaris]|uniref:BTB domain-containing protein n=1 Tax=Phaseolus vulgaris TaxID=3885 RepID=V7BJ01_PHAVU|nr:hypothetical protein PHAVU_006G001300g [Phaseolus vulgaris]ESW17954.1 hypothetical protein PHAVU_006G001300g [Phaseolus vulgaris]